MCLSSEGRGMDDRSQAELECAATQAQHAEDLPSTLGRSTDDAALKAPFVSEGN